jgi:dienelactone hydrolase|nr:tetratricopeptide repeat protein [Candidatus Krumholzibacteria bacterium]
MKISMVALVCCLWSTAVLGAGGDSRPWAYGPYGVGFETLSTHDYARRYKATGSNSFGPRPMQMGIWYPASSEDTGTLLTPAYFQALAAEVETMAPVLSGDSEAKDLDPRVPAFQTRLGANRQAGHFPLVLYASAQGSGGYGNALLCELLASHGFIVATVASKGAYSRAMPFNAEGAEAQFRDLEFIYGALHDYPQIQHDNVSVFGFSFGGLNMIPFSVRHPEVRAMVALDGSIPIGLDLVEAYRFLDIGEQRTPLLAFIGDKMGLADYGTYLEKTPLAAADLFKTVDLTHYDFSSLNLRNTQRPPTVRDTYRAMANLTVAFIVQHSQGGRGYDSLRKEAPRTMFPETQFRAAQAEPQIGRAEYIQLVMTEGLDAAITMYEETRRDFPEYQLFEYGAFRDVGFRLMLQNNFDDAVRAFRVLHDAYPEEADSHRRLGEALMMAGQYTEARAILRRGLELDPDSPALQDILRILAEKESGR